MDLSILITFCNQKVFANQLLDSIFNQKTDYTYEILIAIDGEDDGIFDVLNKYQKEHNNINIFRVQSDKRLLPLSRASMNRMFLLSKSRGTYFCTIDGDDFFISNSRFQSGVSFLESNRQYIGEACSRMHYDHNKKCFLKINSDRTIFNFEDTVTKEYIHVSQCIFRNIFKDGVTYFNSFFFNDRSLVRFMSLYGLIYVNKNYMFAYRTGIDSIYSSQSKINKMICQLAANIANRQLGMSHYFEYHAAKNIIQILRKCRYSPIDQTLLEALEFQKIPIAQNLISTIKGSSIQQKIKLYKWSISRIVFFYYHSIIKYITKGKEK